MTTSPRKVLWFTAITYVMTIIFFIVMSRMGGRINPVAQGLMGVPMAFPLIAVLIVQKLIYKEKLFPTLGLSFKPNWWYLAAIALPVLMALALNMAVMLLLGPRWSPVAGIVPSLFTGFLMGVTLAAASALLEEAAWRGFLYHELRPMGFWRSALVTAALWSLWHIPVVLVFKYPDYPVMGMLVNTALLFSVSITLSCIRELSRSVIPVALAHGLYNTLYLPDNAVFSAGMELFHNEWVKMAVAAAAVLLLAAFVARAKGAEGQALGG